ncbi:hypothetical protein IAU60_001632 [Kwoniella sp. DSM 27419]
MSLNMFSPTLTSPSSGGEDISILMPEKGMDNFEALFNFDEFESGETSSHSHSPTTASPNHTPSPLPISSEEPLTYNPSTSFDFLNADNNMDFPLDFAFGEESKTAGGTLPAVDEIVVKQEPVEFGFDISNTQSPVTQARPMPVPQPLLQPIAPVQIATPEAFPGLPADQQFALQQLMSNILNYQKTFGLELPAAAPAPSVVPNTIQPSMLFASSPSTSVPSSAPAQPSPAVAQPVIHSSVHDGEAEPLRSIEPHEAAAAESSRSARQASVASSGFDDLDSKLDRLVPLNTIFSAGKGKGGKKGGGMSSVVRGDDEDMDDDDSWRPSPEEYKKLSSKEKRQLRNKLSARAFRTRRKDYIGTLEAHIQDRDTVIDEMRSELVTSRTENQDLRRELAALKASTMSILHPESANKSSVSPAMVNALAMSPGLASPAISTNAVAGPGPNTTRRSTTPLNTYNPRKDIPSSFKSGWGGNDNMFGGGSTTCHTLFTPDLVLPPPGSTPAPLRSFADLPRVNLNPHLNDDLPVSRGPLLAGQGNGQDTSRTFSTWSEETPFSLRSMDSYRMQMWSRLAREAAADKASLTGDLRPKFFVEVKEEPKDHNAADEATRAASALAAVATTHISTKLASSFWSAFQGSGRTLDTDKLAAVVTGQAKLKVVASDAASGRSTSVSVGEVDENEDYLSSMMGSLKLQSGQGMSSIKRDLCAGVGARENPIGTLCGFLRHASAMPARA